MENRLRIGLAWGNVADLPGWSLGPRGDANDICRAIRAAGYEGVQGGGSECRQHALELIGIGVVPQVQDADAFAYLWKSQGAVAATCIAGYGYEDDCEADALATAICRASESLDIPIYIETHRASITQDVWRTTELTKRVPEVRFNLDFSHWFTGQEMAYGDFGERLRRMQPIFERTRFLHGRIGNRCCMQVDIGVGAHPFVGCFEQVWQEVFEAFAQQDETLDLWFVPELLGTEYMYARTFPAPDGTLREESDRWEQAKLLVGIARKAHAFAAEQLKERETWLAD